MKAGIRCAAPSDGAAVSEIYGPFVRDTGVSFELEVPDADEMTRRIEAKLPRYPWLVACDRDDPGVRLLGYAYGGSYRERAAYRWSVEVSVYLAEEARGIGLGGRLYDALLAILARQGYCRAYAGITLPNAASVALHESRGFTAIGRFERVGHKAGRWYDVGWWQRDLRELPPAPREPMPFCEIADEFREVFA